MDSVLVPILALIFHDSFDLEVTLTPTEYIVPILLFILSGSCCSYFDWRRSEDTAKMMKSKEELIPKKNLHDAFLKKQTNADGSVIGANDPKTNADARATLERDVTIASVNVQVAQWREFSNAVGSGMQQSKNHVQERDQVRSCVSVYKIYAFRAGDASTASVVVHIDFMAQTLAFAATTAAPSAPAKRARPTSAAALPGEKGSVNARRPSIMKTSTNVLSTNMRTSMAVSPASSGRTAPPGGDGGPPGLTPLVQAALASRAGYPFFRQHAACSGGRTTYVNPVHAAVLLQASWHSRGSV